MAIKIGSTTVTAVNFNGTALTKVIFNGVEVFNIVHTVTYKVDSNISYSETRIEGQNCLNPSTFIPSKSGYTFVGWREDSIASSDVLSSKTMGSSNITLYAVFRQQFTLTLYNDSVSPTDSYYYKYYNNSNIVNPSAILWQNIKSGWNARGWTATNSTSYGIDVANGGTITLTGNVTYYGCYDRIYYIYYNGNGNTGGTTATQSGTNWYHSTQGQTNSSISLSNNGFDKTNYNFVQWALNSTEGSRYNPGQSVSFNDSVTMYAIWEIANYYLIQNGNVLKTFTPLSDTWTMQMSISGNTFEIFDTDAADARGSFYALGEYLPAGFSRLYIKFKVYAECNNQTPLYVKLGMITDATYNTQYAGRSSHPGWIGNPFDGRELATQELTLNDKSTSEEYIISIDAQNLPVNTYHAFFGACYKYGDTVDRIRIIVTDLYLQ